MTQARPILFSAPMIRALLEGRKTQTRRLLKNPEYYGCPTGDCPHDRQEQCNQAMQQIADHLSEEGSDCPYGQPGDLLVVSAPIEGFPNYSAGSNGVIYSKARGCWRPLKVWHPKDSYPSVTLMLKGKKTTRSVHTLVCTAFYGPAPFSGAQVRHLDGDYANSKPLNLAWGTQQENWQDRKVHGHGMEGEKHHQSNFTDEERAHIRWAIEMGLTSGRNAARVLGVSQCSILGILNANELSAIEQEVPEGRIPPLTLELTEVRVQRLQDISGEDSRAEGIVRFNEYEFHCPGVEHRDKNFPRLSRATAPEMFAALWDTIHGSGEWLSNPWVWSLSFRVHQQNVDALLKERIAA